MPDRSIPLKIGVSIMWIRASLLFTAALPRNRLIDLEK